MQLSQDQRTGSTVIGKSSAARITTNANFKFRSAPECRAACTSKCCRQDVVEIVPQYEGFDYVVVGDEILIIDPDSLEIVAIIPV